MITSLHYDVETIKDLAEAEMNLFAMRLEYPITASISVKELNKTYYFSSVLVGDKFLIVTDD